MNEPTDPQDAANVQAMEYWDQVVADLEATEEDYAGAGWETLSLHVGDVTPLTGEHGDRVGLDVLVPDDEYGELQELLDDGVEFSAYRVFKAASGGMVFLVVAMEDPMTDTVVLFPAYYRAADPDARTMLEQAHRDGQIRSYVRRLDGDYVEMNHDNPSLFAPPEEMDDGSESADGAGADDETDDETDDGESTGDDESRDDETSDGADDEAPAGEQ